MTKKTHPPIKVGQIWQSCAEFRIERNLPVQCASDASRMHFIVLCWGNEDVR